MKFLGRKKDGSFWARLTKPTQDEKEEATQTPSNPHIEPSGSGATVASRNTLNPDQQQIVETVDGPILVIAGPGSGKTRTLVERIVHLVQLGVSPDQIMVSTFTEKAAKELITRISNLLLRQGIRVNLNEMYIGTLHSLFLRFLEENREYTRLKKNYRVLDAFEQNFLLYDNIYDFLNLDGISALIGDHKVSLWRKGADLAEKINIVSEEMLDVDALEQSEDKAVQCLAKCYKKYKALLEEENALDFSTIQLETYDMLKNHPVVLQKIQNQIKYFMVDEYQDTNTIQERILLLISSKSNNLCVVGDDDQGLYRFRGATIRNILEFEKNFPAGQCKRFFLRTNYRSHPDIIRFYNEWMSAWDWNDNGNTFRFEKDIIPCDAKFRDHKTVCRLSTLDGTEEDYHNEVLSFINNLQKKGVVTNLNQITFLYRSVKGDEARNLASFLEEHGVKVFSPRSDMYFERDEIRLILGCLATIFPQTLDLLDEGTLIFNKVHDWQSFFLSKIQEDPHTNKSLITWVIKLSKDHMSLQKGTDYNFSSLIYQMLQFPLFSCFLDVDLDMDKSDLRAAYNIGMFTNLISKFEYLFNITIFTPKNIEWSIKSLFKNYVRFLLDGGLSEYEDFDEVTPSGCVSFMTIHQAKGLEFPITIVGSMSGVPRKDFNNLDSTLQENFYHRPIFEPLDRIKFFDFARLFYTAFSRAQNCLVLTGQEKTGVGRRPSAYFEKFWNTLPSWDSKEVDIFSLQLVEVKPTSVMHEYAFTSHILLYENCPRQYEFYKEFQFAEQRKGATMGGSLLHQTIEDIHKAVLRGEEMSLTDENIINWYNTNYQMLIKQLHTYLQQAQLNSILNQILRYRDQNSGSWDKIKEAEVDVSLVRDDYILDGKIDLIEGENGTIDLVDFKSGDKPDVNTSDEYKRQILNQYRRQLEVYAFLVENKYGKKVTNMHLYYPKEESGNPRITFKYQQQNIDNTVASFDEVVHKIESKDFSMTGIRRNDHHCADCDMRFYCNSK